MAGLALSHSQPPCLHQAAGHSWGLGWGRGVGPSLLLLYHGESKSYPTCMAGFEEHEAFKGREGRTTQR